MSRINKGLYTSNDQTWRTPHNILNGVLALSGLVEFDTDAACSCEHVPAKRHIKWPELNGLKESWGNAGDTAWCNPPYGDQLELFMAKAVHESRKGVNVWFLCPARTETQYQSAMGLTVAKFALFIRGKVSYIHPDGTQKGVSPFPSMLLYYGSEPSSIIAKFNDGVSVPYFGATLMLPWINHTQQPPTRINKKVQAILYPQTQLPIERVEAR